MESLVFLLVSTLSSVEAVSFSLNVSPTAVGTAVQQNSPSVITAAPTWGHMELMKRGILTDIEHPNTCGYVDGNINDFFTCAGRSCAFSNSHVGCCTGTSPTDCVDIWTSCHASTTAPAATFSANPSDLYCESFCATLLYPGSTTQYFCTAVESPKTYFMEFNATTSVLAPGYTKTYNQGPGPSRGTRDWIRFVGYGVGGFVLLVIIIVAVACWKRRTRRNAMMQQPSTSYYSGGPPQLGGIPLQQGVPQYAPMPIGGYGGGPQVYGEQQYSQAPYGQQTVYPNK